MAELQRALPARSPGNRVPASIGWIDPRRISILLELLRETDERDSVVLADI